MSEVCINYLVSLDAVNLIASNDAGQFNRPQINCQAKMIRSAMYEIENRAGFMTSIMMNCQNSSCANVLPLLQVTLDR